MKKGNTKPIRLLLVDDHPLFRDGLATLLERDGRFRVVGQAGDGEAALIAVERLLPDVVLMDIQMPRMNGLEATRRLMTTWPDLKIIMLTISDHDEDLFEAIKAGARGYLLKTATGRRELVDAVARVAAGEAIITPALAPRLLAEFALLGGQVTGQPGQGMEVQEDHLHALTPRECEVLELVAAGFTSEEIAARLTIPEEAVRAHLRRVLEKLHVNSRVRATVWLQHRRVA